MTASRYDAGWRRRKDAAFWAVWLLLWGLTWFPPVFSWINDSGLWGILLWTNLLVIAQIVVIWINFAVESRSGELLDDVRSVQWEDFGGKPELSDIFERPEIAYVRRPADRAMSGEALA